MRVLDEVVDSRVSGVGISRACSLCLCATELTLYIAMCFRAIQYTAASNQTCVLLMVRLMTPLLSLVRPSVLLTVCLSVPPSLSFTIPPSPSLSVCVSLPLPLPLSLSLFLLLEECTSHDPYGAVDCAEDEHFHTHTQTHTHTHRKGERGTHQP